MHLYGLHWDGTQELLAPDVPVTDPEVTTTLSGVDSIRGTFAVEVPRLSGLIDVWSTAVVAEHEGDILAMCLVDSPPVEGPALSFTSRGFLGYCEGMPYDGTYSQVGVDPLDVVRHIWDHMQGKPDGNLGLVVDDATSGQTVGTEKDKDDPDSGPYRLSWWDTDDLWQVMIDLAGSTPFDFYETHTFSGPGSGDITHRLRLFTPKAGRRRTDLRFHVGENVRVLPQVETGEYASEVLVLGAGEGKKMRRGRAIVPAGRSFLTDTESPAGRQWRRGRRVKVVDAKDASTQRQADARARKEAARLGGNPDVASIVVGDHDNARLGSWANGDDVHLTGTDLPWGGDLDLWVRVLSTTYRPEQGTAELTVTRTERTTW